MRLNIGRMTVGQGSRIGPLEAIVLAAGFGCVRRRQATAPWRGGVLLDGALAAAFAAPARTVHVVTGADPKVEAAARAFAVTQGQARQAASDPRAGPRRGMAATLRAGVASLPRDAAGAFVFLGDMPSIPHAVLTRLARPWPRAPPPQLQPFGGRRGIRCCSPPASLRLCAPSPATKALAPSSRRWGSA